jgi:polysaccharide export outer membrane protein
MRFGAFSILLAMIVWLPGCGESIQSAGPQTSVTSAPQAEVGLAGGVAGYRLGAGDKMRIIVFGEPELSGEFFVDDGGSVDLPLIGDIPAGGATVGEFEQKVVARFSDGYLRDPKVSIEVLNYRPFFIIGEVKNGGEFPYKGGLTVQDAVAIAGGYSYRANVNVAYIRRAGSDQEVKVDLSQRAPIFPGDNVRIPERFF